MITGLQENIAYCSLTEDMSIDVFEEEIAKTCRKFGETCSEIIVLCDIYGGTPFNALSRCMLKGMNVIGFTGFSLPVIIDLLLSREWMVGEMLLERIEETHTLALQRILVEITDNKANIEDL
jgi:mannose/fructose-specific phosphotransferase system component IIA